MRLKDPGRARAPGAAPAVDDDAGVVLREFRGCTGQVTCGELVGRPDVQQDRAALGVGVMGHPKTIQTCLRTGLGRGQPGRPWAEIMISGLKVSLTATLVIRAGEQGAILESAPAGAVETSLHPSRTEPE